MLAGKYEAKSHALIFLLPHLNLSLNLKAHSDIRILIPIKPSQRYS
jgi:hypothetical protein